MTALAMPWKKTGVTAQPDPSIKFMRDKIDRLGKVKADLAPLTKEEKALAEEIKEKCGAGDHKGTKCLAHITVTPGERFDAKAFQADHPELAAKYMVPSEVTKLEIKPLV